MRDYMAVFERCLQCGWYQQLSHEARRRLLGNVEASEPPTRDVNRDSGTGCAHGGSRR